MHYRTSVILKNLAELWAFEDRQFVWRLYGATLYRKIQYEYLPAPTDLVDVGA
jgi:hypothetical protein